MTSAKHTAVQTYTRAVPKHYRKDVEIIDITPDENGMALITTSRRKYIIRVPVKKPEPESVLGNIAANLREILR